jgi:branched-chain amino acid transport system ATP-binding protein
MVLEIDKISSFYGISQILFDVSLNIEKSGDTVALLGRNGVGKSTTLKAIMGIIRAKSGSIRFLGHEIRGISPHKIARMGVRYVPEERIIFPDLTVRENLELGMMYKNPKGHWDLNLIYAKFPILKSRERQLGGTLSGGEQQMLTIGRSLMSNPTLILLDEPSEGLAPIIVDELHKLMTFLRNEDITILLSEQNSEFSLNLSDYVYILEKGVMRWHGACHELKMKPEVMKRYLGI